MGNALTIFDDARFKAPAHIANWFDEDSNIEGRMSVPALSYEGKVWTISLNGERTKLMKRDSDGDEVPLGTMRVVLLDYAKRRGRAYYEGAYDPAKPGSPICWSDDGLVPHTKVPDDQKKCSSCEKCPLSVKGSKVTEQGKATTACGQHRMLVVAPANDPNYTPLRLKIAITSDWDKNEEMQAQGWFAFNNYTDFLMSKGIKHTAALVTKMKFDPNVAYPKLLFSPDRWLEDDEKAIVKPLTKSDAVASLLNGTWSPAGIDGKKYDEDDDAPTAPVAKAAAPAKEAKPAPVAVDDDDDEVVVTQPVQKTRPPKEGKPKPASEDLIEAAAAKAAAAKPKPAPVVVDDDDDEIVIQTTAAAKPAKAAAPAPIDVPDELADLAGEWGDDD